MKDKESLIEKFTGKPYPALVKPAKKAADDSEEKPYRALVKQIENKRTPRFRIIDHKGNTYGCGYAYLLGWLYTPPDTLSIQTTTHVFILQGKNLKKIEDALMREKVRELCEYNPEKDTYPNEGDPIIEKLSIIDRWAEKPNDESDKS